MQDNHSKNTPELPPEIINEYLSSREKAIEKLKNQTAKIKKDLLKISIFIFLIAISFGPSCTDLIWPERAIQTMTPTICYGVDSWKGRAKIDYLYLYVKTDSANTLSIIQVGKFNLPDTLKEAGNTKFLNTKYNPFVSYFANAGGTFQGNSCVTLDNVDVKVIYKKIYLGKFFLPENVPTKIWVEGRNIKDSQMEYHLFSARAGLVLILIIPFLLMLFGINKIRTNKKHIQSLMND